MLQRRCAYFPPEKPTADATAQEMSFYQWLLLQEAEASHSLFSSFLRVVLEND